MRALYRTVQLAQNMIAPFAQTMGSVLASFLEGAARDEKQSSPNYIYILFETTALTMRHLKGTPEYFQVVEDMLIPPLNLIISTNVTDMIGYAFQIYALFVANSVAMSSNYRIISDSIMGNT